MVHDLVSDEPMCVEVPMNAILETVSDHVSEGAVQVKDVTLMFVSEVRRNIVGGDYIEAQGLREEVDLFVEEAAPDLLGDGHRRRPNAKRRRRAYFLEALEERRQVLFVFIERRGTVPSQKSHRVKYN